MKPRPVPALLVATLALAAPPAGAQSAQGSGRARTLVLDGHLGVPLANGCAYAAEVQGILRPAGARQAQPLYRPSLRVAARLTCQDRPLLQSADELGGGRAMTLAGIEQALEVRGSLVTGSAGRRCLYVPDFSLSPEGGLEGASVAYLCPTTEPGAATGGGPPATPESVPPVRPDAPAPGPTTPPPATTPAPADDGTGRQGLRRDDGTGPTSSRRP